MPRKPDPTSPQRSLFDAARTKAAQETQSDDSPLRVAQLCALIDRAIRNNTPSKVRVQGELSNLTDRTHWYFTLKDADASISCVMFASQIKRLKIKPEPGQEVIVTGRIEFYPPQGRTQLYVETIEPVGIGALERTLRKRIDDLRAQGLLELDRKRPLPTFPRRIAVLTSATGAAWHDVRDTFARRAPWIDLLRVDIKVQGDAAEPEIVSALRELNEHASRLHLDAAILTRGGGSLEDLWAFNELAVAHAIASTTIPIIAAIGHETDTTIAELVADERAATPTQAAMRLSPDQNALREQLRSQSIRLARAQSNYTHNAQRLLNDLRSTLTRALRQSNLAHARSLESLSARLERAKPVAQIAAQRRSLQMHRKQLTASITRRARHSRTQLDALEHALTIASPPSVLQRGYSITLDEQGNVLTDAASIKPRQQLRTRLKHGVVWSNASPPPTTAPPRTKKPSHQFDLFGDSP